MGIVAIIWAVVCTALLGIYISLIINDTGNNQSRRGKRSPVVLYGGPRDGLVALAYPWQTLVITPLDPPLLGYDEYQRAGTTNRFDHYDITVVGESKCTSSS